MMTPPRSISANPRLTRAVPVVLGSAITTDYRASYFVLLGFVVVAGASVVGGGVVVAGGGAYSTSTA